MMKRMEVVDVNFDHKHNRVKVVVVKDDRKVTAITTETLCPKVGDCLWIFESDDLDYLGYNAVAVLVA